MATATVLESPDISLDGLLASPAGRPLLSCIQCGTCAGACPYGDVMRYTPRCLIGMLREGLIDEVIATDDLLSCVTCYDCWAKCPRGLHLTDVLLPLVKEQLLIQLPEIPAELQSALSNTMRYGNPMGESPRKRAAWTKTADVPVPILRDLGRPVDVLWIVECYAAYYPRGQDNARATARVLSALGIDFAILGAEEKCAGECARLVGERGLFETLRISPRIRKLILRKAPAEEIEEVALAEGMVSMRSLGTRLVLEGRTTIEEILRVVPVPEESPEEEVEAVPV